VVTYLLEHGAKVDVSDDAGRHPIDLAQNKGDNRDEARSTAIVGLLQNAGRRTP
jgi:hypothetical protein